VIASIPAFSDKLNAYIDLIKSETSMPIEIVQVATVGLGGMSFAYAHDDSRIPVHIVLPYGGSADSFEQSIAHELTHGLMEHARAYCYLRFVRKVEPIEQISINLASTLVEDIPVNRTIQQNGFSPYSDGYLTMVEKETIAALKRDTAMYHNVGNDPKVIRRFLTYRYALGKTYLQYFDLEEEAIRILQEFLLAFENAYQKIAFGAKEVCRYFEESDPFSSEGHRRILENILRLWKLCDLVTYHYRKER